MVEVDSISNVCFRASPQIQSALVMLNRASPRAANAPMPAPTRGQIRAPRHRPSAARAAAAGGSDAGPARRAAAAALAAALLLVRARLGCHKAR